MNHSNLRRLLFYALCCCFGMFAKQLISPAANLLTDAMHIPGGVGTAFSLMFLTVAAIAMPRRGCCTLMSCVQSLLAISLGRMGSMGLLSPIGYILPGIAMDAMLLLAPKLRLSPAETAVLVNLTGSVSASLAANIIVFRLHGAPLALYASISAVSGAIFGLTSVQIVRLLRKAILLR